MVCAQEKITIKTIKRMFIFNHVFSHFKHGARANAGEGVCKQAHGEYLTVKVTPKMVLNTESYLLIKIHGHKAHVASVEALDIEDWTLRSKATSKLKTSISAALGAGTTSNEIVKLVLDSATALTQGKTFIRNKY